ncbi:MAG: hypothetical protein EP332_09850 [Bacteroidetes bacterium]|nr:MAG: hypothetical protein EP332_09850 [Bacteroidota bacterium]
MRKLLLLCSALLMLAYSCKDKDGLTEQDEDTLLARVMEAELMLSQVPHDLFGGAQGDDSVSLLKLYVNDWVKQQVLMYHAQENLGSELPADIEAKVEQYRRSLLIYEYQRALMAERLDTQVSREEIEAYYQANEKNFELKRNIVRMRYVKVANETQDAAKAKKWFLSDDASDRFRLLEFCEKYAVNSYFDEDSWLSFDDLLKEIPLKNYDEETFLKQNKFVELKDEDYTYWVFIRSFRVKNSTSPLEFEEDNIRAILINQRKVKLLKEMEGSLLDEARNNNQIEWFVN